MREFTRVGFNDGRHHSYGGEGCQENARPQERASGTAKPRRGLVRGAAPGWRFSCLTRRPARCDHRAKYRMRRFSWRRREPRPGSRPGAAVRGSRLAWRGGRRALRCRWRAGRSLAGRSLSRCGYGLRRRLLPGRRRSLDFASRPFGPGGLFGRKCRGQGQSDDAEQDEGHDQYAQVHAPARALAGFGWRKDGLRLMSAVGVHGSPHFSGVAMSSKRTARWFVPISGGLSAHRHEIRGHS